MKKNIGIISILLIVGSIIYAGFILTNYYSFANEKSITHNKRNNSDTLVLVFIGDSWAAYHSKYDEHLKACLETIIKKPTKVMSRGTVGAKTKFIYTAMHDYSSTGTKALLNIMPDYAIISAGINDAVAKTGTKNYCYHYNLIIKRLLSAGIKPIILDMPQVDYRAIYQRESTIAKIRHYFSSWITGAPLWSFNNYRKALQLLISHESIKNNLIYVPASEWNPEGYKDSRHLYFDDHVHLNKKGYYLLDSCLTSVIYHDFKISHFSQ